MYEDFSASLLRGGARAYPPIRENKLNEGKGSLAFYSPTMDTTMKLLAAFFVPRYRLLSPCWCCSFFSCAVAYFRCRVCMERAS